MPSNGVLLASLANGVLFTNVQVEARGQLVNALVPATGVSVSAFTHVPGYVAGGPGATAVTIYSDEAMTTPLASPVTTDVNGVVPGYVAPGQILDLLCVGGPFTTEQVFVVNSQQGVSLGSLSGDVTGLATATLVGTVLGGKTPLTADHNLADLLSASTARTNLGLGSAAIQATSAFDTAGAAATVQTNLNAEVSRATTAEALRAPLASPALTGVPTTPTASPGTNTTQIASTAFVQAAISGSGHGLPSNVRTVASAPGSSSAGDLFLADTSGGTFAIPFPGSPNVGDLVTIKKTDASTNAVTTSGATIDGDPTGVSITTQNFGAVFEYVGASGWKIVAITSAGVVLALDSTSTDIQMDGVQSAGTSTLAARADHVHPTDTTRAPLASPALTGTPTAPTPAPGDSSTRLSTTAFVRTALSGVVSSVANVDMCAPPYNHVPGDDVTADLQTAFNAANTSNRDTTIFFSIPGVYNINGTPKAATGTVGGQPFSYNGQVLFPARAFSAGPITIRIQGTTPPPLFTYGPYPAPAGGVILQSNGPIFTTVSSLLSTGAPITSLPVAALGSPLPSGATVATVSGTNTQTWTLTAPAIATATSLAVSSQTPNFAYPAGSSVVAGSVFDAIAGDAPLSTALTAVHAAFEDITVRSPANPQGNGIDGNSLVDMATIGEVGIDVTTTAFTNLTGSGFAIRFPPHQNGALSRQRGDLQVMGYPTGIIHSEHFTSDNIYVLFCLTGVAPTTSGSVGHTCVYNRLLIAGCFDGIKPSSRANIRGTIDVGDISTYAINTVVNDPGNNLYGELIVGQNSSAVPQGFPVIGAKNLTLTPWYGRRYSLPSDTFTRIANLNSNTFAGATDNTHDVWVPLNASTRAAGSQSDWSIAGGVLKAAVNTSFVYALLRSRFNRPGASRVVRAVVTPSGTYSVYLPINMVNTGIASSSTTNDSLLVFINGGTVGLYKSIGGANTLLATSAASQVTAATTYTFDVIFTNTRGATPTVRVLFGSGNVRSAAVTFADALTSAGSGGGTLSGGVYTLSTAEATQLLDANQTDAQDGVGFFHDSSSSFSYFAIQSP